MRRPASRLPQKAKREAAHAQRGSEIVVGLVELSGSNSLQAPAKRAHHKKVLCRALVPTPLQNGGGSRPGVGPFLLLPTFRVSDYLVLLPALVLGTNQ